MSPTRPRTTPRPRTVPGSRRRSTLLARTAVVVACLALVGACGDDDGNEAGPSPEETTATSSGDATGGPDDAATGTQSAEPAPTSTPLEGDDDAEPTDAAEAAFPADDSPDEASPSADAMLTVTGIRAAAHDGYDRVVFDLGGTGTPGWRVEYVDAALSDGSGLTVDVAGDEILQVVISGSAYPFDSGVEEYAGDNPLDTGLSIVDEVAYDHVFEGYSTAFIGVTGDERPFRAFAMSNPTRLMVDVRAE